MIDESFGKYITNFTVQEMKSRYCIEGDENPESLNLSHSRLVEECKLNYCRNILEFSEKEKQVIDKLIVDMISNLSMIYPYFPMYEWKFIKITDALEGGLPHTKLDCIILPQQDIISIMNYQQQDNNIRYDILDFGGLLLHELVHIMQRYNPLLFNNLYEKIWPFRKAKIIGNLTKNPNQRLNPDAMDNSWVYKESGKYYLPISELSEKTNYNMKYPESFAIPLKKINNRVFKAESGKIKLETLQDYYKEFCNIQQNYHPNEISAVLISKICIYKMGITRLDNNQLLCLRSLMNWLDKNYTIPK